MEPYMTQEHAITQKMKLIGIISHQGTKDHGHYAAITNTGDEWTSYNDAITAKTTLSLLHQTKAYILIYRKMEHSDVTEIDAPSDSTMANQQSGTPLTMEMTCICMGLEPQRKEIPHDSQTKKLIHGLSEDPEDHPAGSIPIIE